MRIPQLVIAAALCGAGAMSTACKHVDVAQVDVKRITYNALRQADCRENEPNTFCERGYANEFEEYERLREGYLREQQEDEAWQTVEQQTPFIYTPVKRRDKND